MPVHRGTANQTVAVVDRAAGLAVESRLAAAVLGLRRHTQFNEQRTGRGVQRHQMAGQLSRPLAGKISLGDNDLAADAGISFNWKTFSRTMRDARLCGEPTPKQWKSKLLGALRGERRMSDAEDWPVLRSGLLEFARAVETKRRTADVDGGLRQLVGGLLG